MSTHAYDEINDFQMLTNALLFHHCATQTLFAPTQSEASYVLATTDTQGMAYDALVGFSFYRKFFNV